MTANVEQFASAGIYKVFWAKNSSGGIAYGPTGALSPVPADAGMSVLDGVQTFNATIQQPDRVNIPGDNGSVAQFLFQSQELPAGDLIVGTMDLTLAAVAQGTSVFAETNFDMLVLNPGTVTFADISLLIIQDAKSRKSGSVGEQGYVITAIPKANMISLGPSSIATAAGNSYTFAVTMNKADVMPWGKTLATADEGATEAAMMTWWSENPVTIHTFVADGVATTFTLDYTVAAAADAQIHVRKGGTLQAYTTNYTVVGSPLRTFTLALAGTTGDVWSVLYEYTP